MKTKRWQKNTNPRNFEAIGGETRATGCSALKRSRKKEFHREKKSTNGSVHQQKVTSPRLAQHNPPARISTQKKKPPKQQKKKKQKTDVEIEIFFLGGDLRVGEKRRE